MIRVRLLAAITVAFSFACGSDKPVEAPNPNANAASTTTQPHHAPSGGTACAALAKTCHAHDKESELAHTCHRLGHQATSEEQCEAKRAECLDACGGRDAGLH